MSTILLILFYLLSPALILFLNKKFTIISKIGVVIIAYLLGIAISLSGILPDNAAAIQNQIAELAVPIALPLLLFSLNIKNWLKLAGKTFLSMILGIVALLIVVFTGYYMFADQIPDAWKVSGMMVGVYTGGTPNLASIKQALEVDNETYIMVHTFDTIYSLLYILFLASIAQRIFLTFMPPFKFAVQNGETITNESDDIENFDGFFSKQLFTPLVKAFGLSLLILAIGGGTSMVLPKDIATAAAILLITTLAIAFSLIPAVNRIKKTFQLGMYFILIFCIVVASMIKVDNLMETSWALMAYIAMGVFGTLFLHVLFAAIFKIDVDTTIITSTALICSPPFVPVVAAGLKNKEVIISGLTVGIIGYAIGNYLGIGTALFLK